MLRVLGLVIKVSLFACLILVLGQLIHWRGRSISDQVKTTISSAERSPSLKKVKKTSRTLLDDAREVIQEQSRKLPGSGEPSKTEKASRGKGSPLSEGIPHDEREELNTLLEI